MFCCDGLPRRRGPLGDEARAALTGAVHRRCGGTAVVEAGRSFTGCVGLKGDTSIFTYVDTSGVVLVGREWPLGQVTPAKTDSLLLKGYPDRASAEDCPHPDDVDSLMLRDSRWNASGKRYAFVVERTTTDGLVGRLVTTVLIVSCSTRFGMPGWR